MTRDIEMYIVYYLKVVHFVLPSNFNYLSFVPPMCMSNRDMCINSLNLCNEAHILCIS